MNQAHHTELDPVDCPLSGTNLIEASAGTGKTYTIASLVLRLLLEKRLSIGQILVVTFTEAATEELKERIRARLKKALDFCTGKDEGDPFIRALSQRLPLDQAARQLLNSALREFDEAAIYTIHGFCHRVLTDHAFETGEAFEARLITDELEIYQRVAHDFWRRRLYAAPPEFITFALNSKFKTDSLMETIRNVITWPDLKVLPDPLLPEFPELSPFRRMFSTLKMNWKEWRDKVQEILLNTNLNGRIYGGLTKDKTGTTGREKKVSLLMDSLDEWLQGDWAVFPIPDNLEKLTARSLCSYAKDDHGITEHPFFTQFEEIYDIAKHISQQMDRYLLYLKSSFAKAARSEIAREKIRVNARGYQDLILSTKKAIEGIKGKKVNASLAKRFKAALIDEFHDTDSAQYFIFRSVFGNIRRPLFLIGDPKQAIYGFRGADIFAYLQATSEVRHKYTLSTNWRSDPSLIKAVNTLFRLKQRPFLFKEVGFIEAVASRQKQVEKLAVDGRPESPMKLWYLEKDPSGPSGKPIAKADARQALARSVAYEISKLIDLGRQERALLGENPVREQDMAVLTRTNDEAMLVQKSLRELGVNSVLYSGQNVFKTREAWEIKVLMSAICTSEDSELVRAALATEIFGLKAEDIFLLQEAGASWEDVVFRFKQYRGIWETNGFITMFRHLMDKEKGLEKLLSYPDGERKISNLLQLSELIQEASTEHCLGLSGLLTWVAEQIQSPSAASDEQELRLESDEQAVKVLTIHKSKGLEFPIVFCPYAWGDSEQGGDQVKFHEPKGKATMVLDLGSPERDKFEALSARELLAENIRLLYVAVTRAKSACYLAWGDINKTGSSAFAYLLCGPDSFSDENVVDLTLRLYEKARNKGLRSRLIRLAKESGGSIEICAPPSAGKKVEAIEKDLKEFRARRFSGGIVSDWGISSFSSLVSGYNEGMDLPDHDLFVYPEEPPGSAPLAPSQTEFSSILEFPRGPKAGSFLHKIMEQVDFATSAKSHREELVRNTLADYGYEEHWTEAICKMLDNALEARLDENDQDLKLSLVPANHRLNELEFYFPLNRITPKELANLFQGSYADPSLEQVPERIETIQFSPARGFMKGYIDMVFEWRGRYYLVDWKSNYLGPSIEYYDQASMLEEMIRHLYFLQYHIYCLALDQYLRCRLPGYSYERHFGAVLYIFLRGMDAERSPQYGVYKARPHHEMMAHLRHRLLDIGHGAKG